MTAPLPAACLAFTATADPRRNAELIHAGIADAAKAKAKLLLMPECALVGYPGAARSDFAGTDWCLVAELEERIEVTAVRAGVAVVLGTAGPLGDGRISNDALVVGAGAKPVRYRKRDLTPSDVQHFAPGPGAGPCLVEVAGWRLGVTICFELRFGSRWAEQAAAGADAFVSIAHMAGADPDPGTKAEVIPNLYSARAAEWATPLLVANTAAVDRWVDSGQWDARGARVAALAEGLLLTELRPRDSFAPWYGDLRDQALRRAWIG